MKLIFLNADKHESLLQIDTQQNRILMGVVKHNQSSQNTKFGMYLQYPKKEVRHYVDFLHADKHQSFLQGDTVINHEHNHKYSQSPQSKNFESLQYLKKKKLGMEFIFSM